MPNHFRVHELLSAAELEEFELFAREPGRTVDELHQWLTEPPRSFNIARGSVGRWKQDFDGRLLQERFSRAGELAATIKAAVKGGEFSDVADAAVMQLTQVVFEQATRLETEGVDPLDVQRMTRSLANLVGGKRQLEQYRAEVARALAVVETEAKRDGISGVDVVGKVRGILGIGARGAQGGGGGA